MENKTIRTKVIMLDGAEYVIAALSMDQVDAYIAPVAGDDIEGIKARNFEMICWSLNNALGVDTPDERQGELALTIAGDAPWTPKRLRKTVDLVLFDRLQNEILAFSGLSRAPSTAGELTAAAPAAPVVQ